MATTDDHVAAIAATATPTPRARDGRRLALTISLYKPGHSGLDATGTGLPMNDDEELLRSIASVIAKVRAGM